MTAPKPCELCSLTRRPSNPCHWWQLPNGLSFFGHSECCDRIWVHIEVTMTLARLWRRMGTETKSK